MACATHLLRTPSQHTPVIQEGHLVMGHLLCQLIESTLFTPPVGR